MSETRRKGSRQCLGNRFGHTLEGQAAVAQSFEDKEWVEVRAVTPPDARLAAALYQ